jgi:DNA-binding NtrC family response regulator
MCESLSRQGYRTRSVRTAKEAEKFLQEHSPVVIITDEVKLIKQYSSCAFIVMTKEDESRKIAEAMKLGALDFTMKNDFQGLVEKSFVWITIGKSLKQFSGDKQKKMVELFRKCSAFQESV